MTDVRRQIILIHGLSIPSLIWKDIAPEMANQGYRVLLYGAPSRKHVVLYSPTADLYGRGYSDAPDTIYDARLYSTQLALLIQHLGLEKAIVAGVSMVRRRHNAFQRLSDKYPGRGRRKRLHGRLPPARR